VTLWAKLLGRVVPSHQPLRFSRQHDTTLVLLNDIPGLLSMVTNENFYRRQL